MKNGTVRLAIEALFSYVKSMEFDAAVRRVTKEFGLSYPEMLQLRAAYKEFS